LSRLTGGECMQNDHLPPVTIDLGDGAPIRAELYPEVVQNTGGVKRRMGRKRLIK